MEVAGKLKSSKESADDKCGDSDLSCDPCQKEGDTSPAIGYCKDCREYLCRPCVKSHRRFASLKTHIVLENEDMPTTRPVEGDLHEAEYCSVHVKTKEPIKFYCPSHNAFGCGDCIVLSHRTCKVEYIDDAAKGFKDSFEFQELMTSLGDTEKKIDEIDTAMQDVRLSNASMRQKAIDDIKTFTRDIKAHIDEQESQLLTKVELMKSDEEKVLSEVACELDKKRQNITDYKLQIQTKAQREDQLFMYAKRNSHEIQKVKDNLENNKRKCKEQKKDVTFKRNADIENILQSNTSLGEFRQTRNVDVTKATISRQGDIDIKTKEDTTTCFISGIVQVTRDMLVLADCNNNAVKVVNTSSRKVTTRLQLSAQPWDLTVLDDCREIAVSLREVKQIKILTVTDTSIQEVRTLNVNGNSRGVSYCNGNLAVIYLMPEKVEVMKTNGTVSSVIQNESIDGTNGYTIFGQNGKELFIKCKNDSVGRFTIKGECLATYSDSDLIDIRAMAVTSDGQLLVCGRDSQNIHVVSQECKKLRVLLSKQDGLCSPLSLCLCEDTGTLYVGSLGNNSLKVFTLQ